MIMRTHKIKLNPTPTQERLLTQHTAYDRAVHNWALRCHNDGKAAKQEPTKDELRREWKAIRSSKFPWARNLSQHVATHAIKALEYGIKAWKDKKRSNLEPRFHSRTRKNAFRVGVGNELRDVSCTDKRIELPNIGSVRMWQPLRFEGRIRMVTVKREAGHWFACVTVEMPSPAPRRGGGNTIGIDLGISLEDGDLFGRHNLPEVRRDRGHQASSEVRGGQDPSLHGTTRPPDSGKRPPPAGDVEAGESPLPCAVSA